ncbi:MAG: MoaD/ThiS family protein [Magnetospirillum sp.]|nr:MoaD/ThiS family protein [Magnetospirillum sp.]
MARATLKLFALLGKHLPPGSTANAAPVEIGEGMTVSGLIAANGLDEADCHLVLLNGNFVPVEARGQTQVAEGDVVAIWPPIGGG